MKFNNNIDIPDEIFIHILQTLNINSLLKLRLVKKAFYPLVNVFLTDALKKPNYTAQERLKVLATIAAGFKISLKVNTSTFDNLIKLAKDHSRYSSHQYAIQTFGFLSAYLSEEQIDQVYKIIDFERGGFSTYQPFVAFDVCSQLANRLTVLQRSEILNYIWRKLKYFDLGKRQSALNFVKVAADLETPENVEKMIIELLTIVNNCKDLNSCAQFDIETTFIHLQSKVPEHKYLCLTTCSLRDRTQTPEERLTKNFAQDMKSLIKVNAELESASVLELINTIFGYKKIGENLVQVGKNYICPFNFIYAIITKRSYPWTVEAVDEVIKSLLGILDQASTYQIENMIRILHKFSSYLNIETIEHFLKIVTTNMQCYREVYDYGFEFVTFLIFSKKLSSEFLLRNPSITNLPLFNLIIKWRVEVFPDWDITNDYKVVLNHQNVVTELKTYSNKIQSGQFFYPSTNINREENMPGLQSQLISISKNPARL